MKTSRLIFITVIGIAVAGCTELEVRRLGNTVVEGIPYYLPKKSFLVTAEYVLQQCSLDKSAPPRLTFKVSKSVTIAPLVEPDEREKFYIPYSSLRNPFKDSDVTIENYDNLTLKSVGATISDKTGETITAAIGTGLRVASLVGGVNLAGTERTFTAPHKRQEFCGERAIALLDELDRLKAQAKGAPDNADAIAAAKAALTYKQVLLWTPAKPMDAEPTSFFSAILYPTKLIEAGQWITKGGIAYLESSNDPGTIVDRSGQLLSLLTQVALKTYEPVRRDDNSEVIPTGLLFRIPAFGLLRVCEIQCSRDTTAEVNNVLIASEHAIPQLGTYVVLPLRNRIFENQTLSLTLSADGVVTKIGLKSNATAAAGLTSANADLDLLQKAKDARDKAKADALQSALSKPKEDANAVRDNNQAIAECLKAQAAVAAAGGTATGTCE
jgi:hypothetical protein